MNMTTNQSSGTAVLEAYGGLTVKEMREMPLDAFVQHCSRFASQAGRNVDWLDAQMIVAECITRLAAPTPPDATQKQVGLNEALVTCPVCNGTAAYCTRCEGSGRVSRRPALKPAAAEAEAGGGETSTVPKRNQVPGHPFWYFGIFTRGKDRWVVDVVHSEGQYEAFEAAGATRDETVANAVARIAQIEKPAAAEAEASPVSRGEALAAFALAQPAAAAGEGRTRGEVVANRIIADHLRHPTGTNAQFLRDDIRDSVNAELAAATAAAEARAGEIERATTAFVNHVKSVAEQGGDANLWGVQSGDEWDEYFNDTADADELFTRLAAAVAAGQGDNAKGGQVSKSKESFVGHVIDRTSAMGGPFIGRCRACGMEGLSHEAVFEPCDAAMARGMSSDDALLMAIDPPSRAAGQGEKGSK
jgi:hypothetical protein